MTIIAFGDSTTAPRGALHVYIDCLRDELPEQGMAVTAINAGIGGNTTQLARGRFGKDVLDKHPDIAIIQFGINDSAVDVWKTPPATDARVSIEDYQRNLEYFVDALQAQHCQVILMTPNPIRWTPALKKLYGKPPYSPADPDGFGRILRGYADRVREVAKAKQVPLIDVHAAFLDYGSGDGRSIDDLLLDGMHPNQKGQRLVADLLIKRLLSIHLKTVDPNDKPTLR